jgi:outer membrane receptor for ferrienterochelin and colicins
VGKRTLCAIAILAGSTAASTAQETDTTLPPVTVTTTAKGQPAQKAAVKKSAAPQQPVQEAPPAPSFDLEPPPEGTSSADGGNAVGASANSALATRAEAPNATVVIEGAQLQQFNGMNVGDVVRRLPGVSFPGVNRSRDIKLRGIGKEYTQVLLDGRPLLDGDTSRNMEVDRIPASFIERIEITRTPLASMESQGAAGTVNIITRRAFGPSGGQVTVGAGHLEGNGTPGELSAWQGGEAGPLRYFIAGGYQKRLVQESATEYVYDGTGAPDGGEIGPQHRKFDEYTFLSRFELAIDPANTLVVSPSYLKTTEDREQHALRLNGGQTYVNRDTHELRERIRETYGANLAWQHEFGSVASSRVFFDYQQGREDTTRDTVRTSYNSSGVITSGPTVQPFRSVEIDLDRIAAGADLKVRAGRHTVETGFGWAQRGHDENAVEGGAPEPDRNYVVTEDIYHAYISDSVSLLGNDLLTVGLRLEHSTTETEDFARDAHESGSTDLNPTLNYRLSAAPNLDVRLGIARTLRRPDLGDLTPSIADGNGDPDDPYVQGNPGLTPEKIWGLDIGSDYYLFNRTGLLAANVFARSFQDKIEGSLYQDAIDNEWYETLRNAGDGHLYGVELEARIPLVVLGLPDLTLWGNATAMKSELKDHLTGQKRRFDEQPDLITNIGFDYYVPAWATTFGLGYNRTYAYDQDILMADKTRQQTDFSALDRLDASARIALDDQVVLTLSASNLLRPDDKRTLVIRDETGAIDSVTVSNEPSPSVYYARLSLGW